MQFSQSDFNLSKRLTRRIFRLNDCSDGNFLAKILEKKNYIKFLTLDPLSSILDPRSWFSRKPNWDLIGFWVVLARVKDFTHFLVLEPSLSSDHSVSSSCKTSSCAGLHYPVLNETIRRRVTFVTSFPALNDLVHACTISERWRLFVQDLVKQGLNLLQKH